MKEQLIKFLQSRTTTFSVAEINSMISIVDKLEEKEVPAKVPAKKTK